MASAITAPPITIEQYLAFESPDGYCDELINGRIMVSPEPKPLHPDVAENLYKLLSAFLGEPYKVGQRVNLPFPGQNSMPSPDVFVMDRKVWNQARQENIYPPVSKALLVVEVVSPANCRRTPRSKAGLYGNNSVELWIVYPKRREIEIVRRGELVISSSTTGNAVIDLPAAPPKPAIPLSDIFKH